MFVRLHRVAVLSALLTFVFAGSVDAIQDEDSSVRESAKFASSASPSKKKASKAKKDEPLKKTHVQTRAFSPQLDGKDADLSSFHVLSDGRLLVCVSPAKSNRKKSKKTSDRLPGCIQVYSPEMELESEIGVPFVATVVCSDASGNLFVAGDGKAAKLNKDGDLVLLNETPTAAGENAEERKAEIRKQVLAEQEQSTKRIRDLVTAYEAQVEKLEEVAEEDRSNSQIRRLRRLNGQIENYQTFLKNADKTPITDEMIEQRMRVEIVAIAATEQDVFMAVRGNAGFEIFRTNHELKEATRIVKRLVGCCGHMDINAVNDRIAVAENTKFQVGVYDRDGKPITRFGQRLSGSNQGFGSCCNPMNVHCCTNGDVLTAESSVGKIKRFDSDGNLVGYIGQAEVGKGCNNIKVDFDPVRDRYYVQYEDANQICILEHQDTVAKKETSSEDAND